MSDLPIIQLSEMEGLCTKYGFDQVIVLARKVGEGGYENLGTHGVDMEHSTAAEAIGEHLRKDVMGWVEHPDGKELVDERVRLARAAKPLLSAAKAAAVKPWGFCICYPSVDMEGRPDEDHAPECRDLRAAIALADKET